MNKQEYKKPAMRTILLESHEMICASEGSNLGAPPIRTTCILGINRFILSRLRTASPRPFFN